MDNLIIQDYHLQLNLHDTQILDQDGRDFFQGLLALRLNLSRVSAPLFVKTRCPVSTTAWNGVERLVTFDIKEQNGRTAEGRSVARQMEALRAQKYGFSYGRSLH